MSVDTEVWGVRASGVAALERELARLRRVQGAQAREQGHVVARASVLNIVVYATREVHARRAGQTIAELALRHPSRAIVVHAGRAPEPAEGGDLVMHAQLQPADAARQVRYEQILIRACGETDEQIASAVIPLLLPDLPVFLWWTGTPPLSASHFHELLSLADRLIVDSADFARPDATLPEIARVCDQGHGQYGVTDLNWTRLTPWRDLLAAFFDVPAWRPYLDSITGIRTGFAVDADGRDIHPSQALLLLGWLTSRLGWRLASSLAPSEAGGLLFAIHRADGGRVNVRVRPRFERGVEEGHITGVRLQAERDGRQAEFVVKRPEGAGHVTAQVIIDGARVFSRTVPLPAPGVVDLVGEELTIARSDRVYEEELHALVALSSAGATSS
ncbi:glucose-6-phosphate dehydrogenase assembly protein OpcA [soil metagenome]